MTETIFELRRASLNRPSGETALRDITWTLQDGERWAITGAVGSGKTSLCQALLGQLIVRDGERVWPMLDRMRHEGQAIGWPSDVFGRVAFKEESHLFSYSRHYLQQRFNFIEPEDDLKLEQFLRDGLAEPSGFDALMQRFRISELLGQSMITLSNGQTRRARLAKAMLRKPVLLILDEPFAGLDKTGVAEFGTMLEELADAGQRLLIATQSNDLPDWVTHVIELDSGTCRWSGPKSDWSPKGQSRSDTPQISVSRELQTEPVVELRDVTIAHGGKTILDGINWRVRRGERWGLTGPNGSGKSTLLSVINGDHPQAYGNDVSLFGKRRGTGESLWDLRRRIGYLSPELHFYFSEPLTALEAVVTGLFDVVVRRDANAEQQELARSMLDAFGIAEIADRPFRHLSTGQQRLVLIARALVKRPELVILDEPFQALDDPQVSRCRRWLDTQLTPTQTLLFVSHREQDFPRLDYRLDLTKVPS